METRKLTLQDLVERQDKLYVGASAIALKGAKYSKEKLPLWLFKIGGTEWALEAKAGWSSYYWLRGEWMYWNDERRYVWGGCTRYPSVEEALEAINSMIGKQIEGFYPED